MRRRCWRTRSGTTCRPGGAGSRTARAARCRCIAGLVAIIIFFQVERPSFLTDQNLVNLLEEAAIYIVLGAAETFVLLLSEIDLSIGYGMGIGGFVIAELIAPPVNFPWWLGIICGVSPWASSDSFRER